MEEAQRLKGPKLCENLSVASFADHQNGYYNLLWQHKHNRTQPKLGTTRIEDDENAEPNKTWVA